MSKYNKDYYEKNKDAINEKKRKYYQEHKEQFRRKQRERNQERSSWNKEYRINIKTRVLAHYSQSIVPKCVWCGEKRLPCLSIDHIEGCGTAERRRTHKGGYYFYLWLEKQGYPTGFQTLCMNCQFIKKFQNNEQAGSSSGPNLQNITRDEKFKEEG